MENPSLLPGLFNLLTQAVKGIYKYKVCGRQPLKI